MNLNIEGPINMQRDELRGRLDEIEKELARLNEYKGGVEMMSVEDVMVSTHLTYDFLS